MPTYHFYRLVNNVDDVCYIGQTRRDLRKRLYDHRHGKMDTSSKIMFDKYGRDSISIVLIHSLELQTIREAHREERRIIEEYAGRCVNLQMPFREADETKTLAKIYRDEHKTEIATRQKAYYRKNKERLKLPKEVASARNKAYREANQEREKMRKREWYYKNKANTKDEHTVVENHESQRPLQ